MPLSQFSTGCNCDCCLVYESRYCEFIADNFPDDHASGGAFPIQGGIQNLDGIFDDVENWTYQRSVCFSDRSDCTATTDARSGLKYSPDTYVKGIQGAGENANRAILVNPLDQFQWYTLMSFMKCETCSTDQTNALWFCFDYEDTDNWLALEIKYEPDFDSSPGFADRIFLIRLWENVDGTIQLVDAPQTAKTIDLGDGANQVDVFIEITITRRSVGGDLVTLNMGVIGSTHQTAGYRFTAINGGKLGWITRFASDSEVGDANCTVAGNGIYDKHQQIYKTKICHLAEDVPDCCTSAPPSGFCCDNCSDTFPGSDHTGEFDATISGFTDSTDCLNCDFINDTFTLQCGLYMGSTCLQGYPAPDNIDNNRDTCTWGIIFSDYHGSRDCSSSVVDESTGYTVNKSWAWLGLHLIKYPILTGSTQTDEWRLHLVYRMEVSIIEVVLDADGNPVNRGKLDYKCNDLYLKYIPSENPSVCLLDGTETFSMVNDIDTLSVTWGSVTASTSFSDWCNSSGTGTVEATEI